MERGRRYARKGQVLDLGVRRRGRPQVQGSRRRRTWCPRSPDTDQRAMGGDRRRLPPRSGSWHSCSRARCQPELEAVFRDAGVDLFPRRWTDLRTELQLPRLGNPCKHIAAVLYVFADQLDADPWLLLEWRGRTREELLAPFQARPTVSGRRGRTMVAVRPGRPPAISPPPIRATAGRRHPRSRLRGRAGRPGARPLEELDIQVAGQPLREALQPAYSSSATRGPRRKTLQPTVPRRADLDHPGHRVGERGRGDPVALLPTVAFRRDEPGVLEERRCFATAWRVTTSALARWPSRCRARHRPQHGPPGRVGSAEKTGPGSGTRSDGHELERRESTESSKLSSRSSHGHSTSGRSARRPAPPAPRR